MFYDKNCNRDKGYFDQPQHNDKRYLEIARFRKQVSYLPFYAVRAFFERLYHVVRQAKITNFCPRYDSQEKKKRDQAYQNNKKSPKSVFACFDKRNL
jgi:hypothetical protein